VVVEDRVAQGGPQLRGDLDQAAVALPGPGVEQLLALLLGQAPLGAAALLVVALVLVVAPFGEALLQRGRDLGELREEVVAELVVEPGAQIFVTRGEAQRLDGFEGELAVQAQRALDRDLRVAEGGVGEDLRLKRFLEVEERAADALWS